MGGSNSDRGREGSAPPSDVLLPAPDLGDTVERVYYVVCAVIIVVGLVLITPAGARVSVDWRRLNRRGEPARESSTRPDLVRNSRIAGSAMIVAAAAMAVLQAT